MAKLVHLIDLIRPGGGPAGYLYNLNEGLSERKEVESVIVSTQKSTEVRLSAPGDVGIKYKIKTNLFKMIGHLKDFPLFPSFIIWMAALVYEKKSWKKPLPESFFNEVSANDIVVFHSIKTASRAQHGVRKFRAIWVMPHGPITHSDERIAGYRLKFGNSFVSEFVRKMINSIEVEVFVNSDGVLIANSNACDSYFIDYPGLRSKFVSLNFEYVLSGVPKSQIKRKSLEVREEIGIDTQTPIVGFYGRYNIDKGFDTFLKLSSRLKSDNSKIKIICAGIGNFSKDVDSNLVTDLGWRQDIADLVSASSVIVVPNKHSYFDLIVLEALSLGTPVVTSDIGGHKYYKGRDFGVEVCVPDDIEDFCNKILETLEKRDELSDKALDSYQKFFSIQPFVDRHIALAKKLLAASM